MHESSKDSNIAIRLCLFFRPWKVLSFYQQRKQKWRRNLETDWTPHDNSHVRFKFKVQSKLVAIVADISDPMTLFHSRLCRLFVTSCVYYVSWICKSKFSWISCGLQSCVERRRTIIMCSLSPQSKLIAITADFSDPMTLSHSRFCCLLVTSCVYYDVSWLLSCGVQLVSRFRHRFCCIVGKTMD